MVTASAYQALRTPGLPETYWWAEGATGGDPVLKPEKNNAVEFSWQQSEKKGDLYDTANLLDEIDYMPEWKANLGVDFKLPRQSVFGVALKYVGERQTIYTYAIYGYGGSQQFFDLMTLDAYTTVDINVTVPITERFQVVSHVKQRGVKIAGAKILDIGCGIGTYALSFAREAQRVTAIPRLWRRGLLCGRCNGF